MDGRKKRGANHGARTSPRPHRRAGTQLATRTGQVEAHAAAGAAAFEKYRSAVAGANPDLPAELVTGATPDELDASVTRAKEIVKAIQDRIAAQHPRIPAGGATRQLVDTSAMSPAELIRHGLTQPRG